jgi:hypothetical protein
MTPVDTSGQALQTQEADGQRSHAHLWRCRRLLIRIRTDVLVGCGALGWAWGHDSPGRIVRPLTRRRRTVRPYLAPEVPAPTRLLIDPLETILTDVFSEWEGFPPIAKHLERPDAPLAYGVMNPGTVHVDVGTLGHRDDYASLDINYCFAEAGGSPVLNAERCSAAFGGTFTAQTEIVLLISHAPVSEESFAAPFVDDWQPFELSPQRPTDQPIWILTVGLIDIVLLVVVDISATKSPDHCRALFETARDLCARHFEDPSWESPEDVDDRG